MSSQIIKRGFKAVAVKHTCLFKDYPIVIPQAFESFRSRMSEIPEATSVTAALYATGDTAPQRESMQTFYVGVIVDHANFIPQGMELVMIPDREFAQITHVGPVSNIGNSYMVLESWISSRGYKQVSDWIVELYDERFNPVASDSEMEIYTPVKSSVPLGG